MDTNRSLVLIAEDDPTQRCEMAELVTSIGHHVLTASDGGEALEKLRTAQVDVVITDLVMPGLDGVELLKQMVAHGSRIPVIALTGFGSVDQAISIVHDQKAFWFLEKPV